MKKTFSNKQILDISTKLNNIFVDTEDILILPIKINFYLQKNIELFNDLASSVESSRFDIGRKYGEPLEDGSFKIKKENIAIAQKALDELQSLEQIADIYVISISELENIQLNTKQMNALLFMLYE